MSFKKNKYIVIKNVINKDLSTFLYNYILIKKQVFLTCIKSKYISPYEFLLGEHDSQVPNTYASYGDIAMETLLLKCQPIMEKNTELKLSPAYAYTRVYKKNDVVYLDGETFIASKTIIGKTPILGESAGWVSLSRNQVFYKL